MTQYPGQDTDYYIVVDGATIGPFRGLENLAKQNINPHTPVWYDGLKDWMPAYRAELTSQIFDPGSRFSRAMMRRDENAVPAEPVEARPRVEDLQPAPEPAEPVYESPAAATAYVAVQARPAIKSYWVWSVVCVVLFNLVAGIVALIYSFKVRSKLRRDNFESAQRCSESAQWWIAVSICLGLIACFGRLLIGRFIFF